MQVDMPAVEKVPALQVAHTGAPSSLSEKVPPEHRVQADASALEKVPLEQTVQTEAPDSENFPVVQGPQNATSELPLNMPAAHGCMTPPVYARPLKL